MSPCGPTSKSKTARVSMSDGQRRLSLERVSEPLSCHAMLAHALAPLVAELMEIDVLRFLRAGGERCDLAGAPRVAA